MKKIEIYIALFLGLLVSLSFCEAFAAQPFSGDPTIPLAQLYLNTASSAVNNVSWVAVASTPSQATSSILAYNSGTSPLMMGVGTASNAVTAQAIIPLGSAQMVPVQMPANKTLFVKSKDANQSAGFLNFSLFQ